MTNKEKLKEVEAALENLVGHNGAMGWVRNLEPTGNALLLGGAGFYEKTIAPHARAPMIEAIDALIETRKALATLREVMGE